MRGGKRALVNTDYHCTLTEVAEELGVSRERARQIELKALWKAEIYFRHFGYSAVDCAGTEVTEVGYFSIPQVNGPESGNAEG